MLLIQTVWLLGMLNGVYLGDRLGWLDRLPPDSVHLVITSPPYNVGIEYDNHNDVLPLAEYLEFLRVTWEACYRVLVDGGRVCINVPSATIGGNYEPLYAYVVSQMRELGYIMRCDILWYKQNISNRTAWGSWKSPSNPYVVQPYEFVLVFSKGSKRLDGDPALADITDKEFVEFSNSFWAIKPQTQPKGHPVPFPEELVYRLIKFYSYKGNVVLDPFAGSGTVGVVARKTGRQYVLIEKSATYVDLINKAMRQGMLGLEK